MKKPQFNPNMPVGGVFSNCLKVNKLPTGDFGVNKPNEAFSAMKSGRFTLYFILYTLYCFRVH